MQQTLGLTRLLLKTQKIYIFKRKGDSTLFGKYSWVMFA